MGQYILRRLWQALLTILGVMLITFVLFRVVAGDIAAANLGEKATERAKATWRHRHGYDLPTVVNVHHRLLLTDRSVAPSGDSTPLVAKDAGGSRAGEALALVLAGADDADFPEQSRGKVLFGRWVFWVDRDTPIERFTDGKPLMSKAPAQQTPEPPAPAAAQPDQAATQPATEPAGAQVPPTDRQDPAAGGSPAPEAPSPPEEPALVFRLSDGGRIVVNVRGIATIGDFIDSVNAAPGNDGRLVASISDLNFRGFFRSQFFQHLWVSATFQSRDLKDNRKLTEIIADRAPASLALTVPALAWEFIIGMVLAALVAYYRGTIWDKLGVLLSVLFMCVPTLALMIYGQALMFEISPRHAFGVTYVQNIYVPITILVIAGLGAEVRFYRTIILDETNRDYVRTARAKGAPLPAILFKHVLRNCMLPILTSLILTIPFLMMGSLLFETYFGIPGLGDLMITAISSRNEPVINGLVFLTSLIYTVGLLLTDLSYAVFDPRIRLQ